MVCLTQSNSTLPKAKDYIFLKIWCFTLLAVTWVGKVQSWEEKVAFSSLKWAYSDGMCNHFTTNLIQMRAGPLVCWACASNSKLAEFCVCQHIVVYSHIKCYCSTSLGYSLLPVAKVKGQNDDTADAMSPLSPQKKISVFTTGDATNFLDEIFRVLLRARRILAASYCIGYFIPETDTASLGAHEVLQVCVCVCVCVCVRVCVCACMLDTSLHWQRLHTV